MFHKQDVIVQVNQVSGNIVPSAGATITVYIAGTNTVATLYLDAAGTQSSPNPVTADSSGRFDFYVDSGLYDMYIVSTGAAPYWLRNVVMINVAEYFAVVAGQPVQQHTVTPIKGYLVLYDSVTGHYISFGVQNNQIVALADLGTIPPEP